MILCSRTNPEQFVTLTLRLWESQSFIILGSVVGALIHFSRLHLWNEFFFPDSDDVMEYPALFFCKLKKK